MKPAVFHILSLALLTIFTAPGCATTPDPAMAKDIDGLRQEIRDLRAELQELKKATVLTEGLSIQLPVSTREGTPGPDLVISITKDGNLILGADQVSKEQLKERLEKLAAENPQTRIVIQADSSITHQQVMDVMSLAKAAGISRLAIATQK